MSRDRGVTVDMKFHCPVFDCKHNMHYVCKEAFESCQAEMANADVVSDPPCKIERSPGPLPPRCLTINKDGVNYRFVSHIEGQGTKTGLFSGKGSEVYAVKYKKGALKNVLFYHDKVLKWIPKNQLLLPGFSINGVEIDERSEDSEPS